MVEFMQAAIESRIGCLISGGTGAGKTTLLGALSAFIPAEERLVTIEDSAELILRQAHCVRMETRPANSEGAGEITVELFDIDERGLERLDRLEGYPKLYQRKVIQVDGADAWIYYTENEARRNYEHIPDGDWFTYYAQHPRSA